MPNVFRQFRQITQALRRLFLGRCNCFANLLEAVGINQIDEVVIMKVPQDTSGSVALQRESNLVDVRKQRTAFPPNFIHSLDGSHMMMTALACRDAGIRFAGLHDSFWTHACDVDQMNHILRENFVELYSKPILENLLESFQASYPELTFSPLPERGDFDLQEVLKSPYFFNRVFIHK